MCFWHDLIEWWNIMTLKPLFVHHFQHCFVRIIPYWSVCKIVLIKNQIRPIGWITNLKFLLQPLSRAETRTGSATEYIRQTCNLPNTRSDIWNCVMGETSNRTWGFFFKKWNSFKLERIDITSANGWCFLFHSLFLIYGLEHRWHLRITW